MFELRFQQVDAYTNTRLATVDPSSCYFGKIAPIASVDWSLTMDHWNGLLTKSPDAQLEGCRQLFTFSLIKRDYFKNHTMTSSSRELMAILLLVSFLIRESDTKKNWI
jgi:hypothetical protein